MLNTICTSIAPVAFKNQPVRGRRNLSLPPIRIELTYMCQNLVGTCPHVPLRADALLCFTFWYFVNSHVYLQSSKKHNNYFLNVWDTSLQSISLLSYFMFLLSIFYTFISVNYFTLSYFTYLTWTDAQNLLPKINGRFTIISSHIFAKYIPKLLLQNWGWGRAGAKQ